MEGCFSANWTGSVIKRREDLQCEAVWVHSSWACVCVFVCVSAFVYGLHSQWKNWQSVSECLLKKKKLVERVGLEASLNPALKTKSAEKEAKKKQTVAYFLSTELWSCRAIAVLNAVLASLCYSLQSWQEGGSDADPQSDDVLVFCSLVKGKICPWKLLGVAQKVQFEIRNIKKSVWGIRVC